jgi:hypothetical protein
MRRITSGDVERFSTRVLVPPTTQISPRPPKGDPPVGVNDHLHSCTHRRSPQKPTHLPALMCHAWEQPLMISCATTGVLCLKTRQLMFTPTLLGHPPYSQVKSSDRSGIITPADWAQVRQCPQGRHRTI